MKRTFSKWVRQVGKVVPSVPAIIAMCTGEKDPSKENLPSVTSENSECSQTQLWRAGQWEDMKKNRIRCEKRCCRGDTLIQRTGNCCGRGLAGAGGNIGKDLKDEDLNLAVDGVERWKFKLESETVGKAHPWKYLMWTIIKVQAWISDWLRVNVSIFRGMSNSSEDVWKTGEKRGLKGYSAYPNIA